MKRLWIIAVASLGLMTAPGMFAQIDMSQGQGQGPVLSNRNQGPTAPNVIPADTQFEIQLKDTLDTAKDSPLWADAKKKVGNRVAGAVPIEAEIAGSVPGVAVLAMRSPD